MSADQHAESVVGVWKVNPEAKVLHSIEKCEHWAVSVPAHKNCVTATVHRSPLRIDGRDGG